MTHEEIQRLAALNAISAASPEEVAELRRHLEGCSECRRAADDLDEAAALLALSVDPIAPPPQVREALLKEIGQSDRRPTLEGPVTRSHARWWLSAAAAVMLALWGWMFIQLSDARSEQKVMRADIAKLNSDRQKLSETIAALSAPGTRSIQLAGQSVAPGASARVFLDTTRRRAFVFFQGLPVNPENKSYQLWIIPSNPAAAPQSAGVFNVDAGGAASLTVQNLPLDTMIKALAVTLEPKGGMPAPTGEKYLVGM